MRREVSEPTGEKRERRRLEVKAALLLAGAVVMAAGVVVVVVASPFAGMVGGEVSAARAGRMVNEGRLVGLSLEDAAKRLRGTAHRFDVYDNEQGEGYVITIPHNEGLMSWAVVVNVREGRVQAAGMRYD